MRRHSLKKVDLLAILERFGCYPRKGRGPHDKWCRDVAGGRATAPIPRHRVIKGGTIITIRRNLGLTPADGVSDEDFFGF